MRCGRKVVQEMIKPARMKTRPLSPNIQIYRPQLTSVLSIMNRLTGVALSLFAIALVIWLTAAANGPQSYSIVQSVLRSWIGKIALFGWIFSFYFHLCAGIRHLVWDAGLGFELRYIYATGWIVAAGSVVLTVVTWVVGLSI